MKCPKCGAEMERVSVDVTEEISGVEVKVDNVPHMRCPECGEMTLEKDDRLRLVKAQNREVAKAKALLLPEEIAAVRKSLGFNQRKKLPT